MHERDVGRVVVAVDESLAGLRALREAVGLARRCGMEVRAVRTYHPPRDPVGESWNIGLGPQPLVSLEDQRLALERDAVAAVARAFGLAMGGVPRDVVVRIETEGVPLHRALAASAYREDDVLVVAAPRRRHWWWPSRHSVAGRCIARAACPVLVVPAPQGARDIGGHWPPWRRLQQRRELNAFLGELIV
jgi:nucleotide-binding universal stress UspA family protein